MWFPRYCAQLSLAVSLAAATSIVAGSAQANGRFPATTNVQFQPGDDSLILLPTTFGLLLSKDDGQSFHWICEDTIGYGGTFDPDYAVDSDGAIYATTFDGLKVSTDGSCTYVDTSFFGDLTGGTNLDPITGHWVGEIEVASDGKIWAATSTGGESNDIYVSTDGSTFNSANNWHETAWWKTLRVAKSNADVVYVSGFQIPLDLEPSKAMLFKTSDGGANWTDLGVADFAFGAQPNLFIEGISPSNPNIVFARVIGARAPQGDDLYRSTDGGSTWSKVLEMDGTISAFVIRSDESVLAATTTPCTEDLADSDAGLPNKGCVLKSVDGSADSWVKPATEPRLACLGERDADNSLFACAGNWEPDNFALGRTEDSAESWEQVVRFIDITGPLQCPAETAQNMCEQLNWPSLCIMLGICGGGEDAGISAIDAGSVIIDPPADDSCMGCQSTGSGGLIPFFTVLAFFGLTRRRQGQKRSQR